MEWNVYKWSVGLFFSRVALRPQKPHTAYYGLGGAEGLDEGTALTSVSKAVRMELPTEKKHTRNCYFISHQRFLVPSRCSAASVKVNMVPNVHKLIRDGDHQNDSCIKMGSDETILMFQ